MGQLSCCNTVQACIIWLQVTTSGMSSHLKSLYVKSGSCNKLMCDFGSWIPLTYNARSDNFTRHVPVHARTLHEHKPHNHVITGISLLCCLHICLASHIGCLLKAASLMPPMEGWICRAPILEDHLISNPLQKC